MATVAGSTEALPLAGEGEDDALQVDLSDEMVAGVGDIDLAEVVDGDVFGLVEFGVYGAGEVASGAGYAGTGDSDYHAVGLIDSSYPVVEGIGDEDVAVVVHVHAMWGMECGVEGRSHRHPRSRGFRSPRR